jgi:transposase-like protein
MAKCPITPPPCPRCRKKSRFAGFPGKHVKFKCTSRKCGNQFQVFYGAFNKAGKLF